MTDVQGKPHFTEKEYNGSSSVTDEGEGDTCVGDRVGDNGDVQDDLDRQMSHDPGREKRAGKVCTVHGDHTEPPQEQTENEDQENGSGETEFFADNRIDHIILGFGYEAQFLYAVSETTAKKPTAPDRIKSLNGLESFFIFFRIPPDCQTLQTVTLRSKKNCNKSDSRTPQSQKLQVSGIGHKDQQHTNPENDDRGT